MQARFKKNRRNIKQQALQYIIEKIPYLTPKKLAVHNLTPKVKIFLI
jgi:hypothetical protein